MKGELKYGGWLCFLILYSIFGARFQVAWSFDFGIDMQSLFISIFYFYIGLSCGRREKKTKGVAFWGGELGRRGRDKKKYTRDE